MEICADMEWFRRMSLAKLRSRSQQARTLLFALATVLAVDSLLNSALYSAKESEFFLYMMALLVVMCRNQNQGNPVAASSMIGA